MASSFIAFDREQSFLMPPDRVIESTHRITYKLTDDPRGRPARVRFFYES
jgi:hypothetical protein